MNLIRKSSTYLPFYNNTKAEHNTDALALWYTVERVFRRDQKQVSAKETNL